MYICTCVHACVCDNMRAYVWLVPVYMYMCVCATVHMYMRGIVCDTACVHVCGLCACFKYLTYFTLMSSHRPSPRDHENKCCS